MAQMHDAGFRVLGINPSADSTGDDFDRVAVFRQLGYGYCLLAYNSRNWVGDGCFEPAGGAAAASLLALMGLTLVYASRYPVFSTFRGIRVRTRPRHADKRRSTVIAKG